MVSTDWRRLRRSTWQLIHSAGTSSVSRSARRTRQTVLVGSITLTDDQRIELERRVRSQTLDARSVRRARIVLLAAAGIGNHEIARRLVISRGQVIAWCGRFAAGGVEAIDSDLPRSGRKPRIDAAEIVRITTQTKPEGAGHWSTRKLAGKRAQAPSGRNLQGVARSIVRRETRRHRWLVHVATRACFGSVLR